MNAEFCNFDDSVAINYVENTEQITNIWMMVIGKMYTKKKHSAEIQLNKKIA